MLNPKVIVEIKENQIKYIGHEQGHGELLTLRYGYKMDSAFYEYFVSLAEGCQKEKMKPASWYSVEEMCGDVIWTSLHKWNRNAAGICIADAVWRKRLHLYKRRQHTKSYQTNLYRLLSAEEQLDKERK